MSGYIQSLMGANEKVIVVERQHWLVWVPSLLLCLLLAAVIIAVSAILVVMTQTQAGNIGLVLLVLLIIPLFIFLKTFLDWYFEQYSVTTRRIVQAEGIINKSVIDSSLEKINDVVLSQSVFGRILDYGDLEILTGSEIGINKLHRIQSPVRFKRAMLDAKEAMRGYNEVDDHGQAVQPHARNIAERVAELDDMRTKGLITDAEYQEKRAQLMNQI